MAKKNSKKVAKPNKVKPYACGVCGLAIIVDNLCGCVDTPDIICCDEEMKPKR